jgi:multidrug efflux pump
VVAERIRNSVPPVPGGRLRLFVEQDIRFGGRMGQQSSYDYTLLADDSSQLKIWAERVKAALEQLPELTGFDDELVTSQQIMLEVDRSLARRLGVGMADVTQALNNAFGQRQVSTIYNQSNQYRVVMEVAPEHAQGPEALDRLHVVANGQRIPLSAFSRYGHSAATDRVSRWGQFASESISFELRPGVSLSEGQAAIDRAVARLAMPTEIQGRVLGDARMFERIQGNQPLAVLFTLLIVYIVLGVLYESYRHPLTILSTLPSGSSLSSTNGSRQSCRLMASPASQHSIPSTTIRKTASASRRSISRSLTRTARPAPSSDATPKPKRWLSFAHA